MNKNCPCSLLFVYASLFFAVFSFLLGCPSALAAEPQDAAAADMKKKARWPAHLRVLTGPNGGQWFQMGEPLVDILSRNVAPASSRSGGGLSNIAHINGKTADIGFSLACFLGAAQSGEPEYQHIATENVTLVANVYPQVLYVLVRKDFAMKHGIDSMETLLSKKIPLRFASLKPGTASEFILSMLLKHGYNTSFEALKEQGWSLAFNDYAETADNFVDGSIDCFAYTAGTEVPLIRTLEEHTQAVILPLAPEVLKALSKKFKTGTHVIQPGDYQSVTEPILTLGDATCLVIRKDFPDDLAYAVTKALWENRQYVSDVVRDFKALSPEKAMPEGLPVHPGARMFWETLKK